jgi:subtilisin family serine protease
MKEIYGKLSADDLASLRSDITLFGIYYHGTGVADVAAKGNPFIRLLMVRNTYDHHQTRTCPTIDGAYAEANMIRQTIDYIKGREVRVVNMSWGQNPSMVEKDLELNGVGKSVEDRRKLARRIFNIVRDTLYTVIKDATDILFITGSTNFGNDAAFDELIPSSFALPNLLVVGAADKHGRVVSFAGEKSNADVYALGVDVEARIPGGDTLRMSGVSVAAPAATNLAAKLLAIDQDLRPTEIVDVIVKSASFNEQDSVWLINPLASIAEISRRE